MKRKRAIAESPWASFSDALSGMLFVFVITTFWFALQLAEARARTEQERSQAALEKEKFTRKEEIEASLVDADRPDSLTSCLERSEGDTASVLEAEADPTEARVSLYLENVAWFATNETTFKDADRAEAALGRVASCIGALLVRPDLELYRLRVYVEGHTDAVSFRKSDGGSDASTNWELSGARAARVLRRVRDASPEISTAQDQGQVELIAVGWAELKPALSRLCRAPVDHVDETVCDASPGDERVGALLEHAAIFDRDVNRGCDTSPLSVDVGLSESELLRRWANRCLDPSGIGPLTERRLAMLRRVDLRIELLPRVTP